ncbi:pyridoxamine 5'-phosphate oxidase-related, FMN-binding protein [Streptomyces globisporus]|uniref:Pyridoxamine 5'-phosphate oxidase-related, FMN-binding protein n=1 Tax=Streptomyces globisporus TaxID=1908 RepID=A0ABN8UTQ0_STRGL|nr:pyridoxamine 5'-phosphate oxidase-related, FMN-binding protein [Streptomyces globisporus]
MTAVDSPPNGPRSPEQRKREALERLVRDNDVWVATADATGEPCLVPLAFWWDGEAVWLATRDTNPTGRNLCSSGGPGSASAIRGMWSWSAAPRAC